MSLTVHWLGFNLKEGGMDMINLECLVSLAPETRQFLSEIVLSRNDTESVLQLGLISLSWQSQVRSTVAALLTQPELCKGTISDLEAVNSRSLHH